MRRLLPVLTLLPLLAFLLGASGEARLSETEVEHKAGANTEVGELLEKPTVESSARYESGTDTWFVTVTEEVSGSTVAKLRVDDDSGDVEKVELSPNARGIDYPSLSEEDAVRLASANQEVREVLSRHEGHTTDAEYEDGEWTVHFRVEEGGYAGGVPSEDGTKEVARVGIDDDTWVLDYVWSGDQVGWNMSRGEYGAYGKHANYPWIWGPLALLFALAFFRNDKLLSLRNLDLLALLGFLISHHYFRIGDSDEAVFLWYPPLIYLFIRTLLMGFGVGERVEKTSNFPTLVLFILAALTGGLLIGLNLDARVIDVGYAGVVGADRILDGTLPYGDFPDDVGTGDTYGPLNYLLYVPFVFILGFSGEWDYLPAAHAVTILAFLVGAFAMLRAGWRLSGPRAGAAMAFAWCAFPYTLYSTNNNTNDVIVAAAAAVGLAFATSAAGRGAAISAGFAIKLYPALLAPLWMLHGGTADRRGILRFLIGGLVVFALSFWVLLLGDNPLDSLKLFYERTLAFQGDRQTPWTIFTRVPALSILQQPVIAGLILLAFIVALYPKKRTVRRLAAFSAALVIGVELTTNYWFYTYVIWFEPFVFLALLTATDEKTPLDSDQHSDVSHR
jgi:hypothetical protein